MLEDLKGLFDSLQRDPPKTTRIRLGCYKVLRTASCETALGFWAMMGGLITGFGSHATKALVKHNRAGGPRTGGLPARCGSVEG